MLLFPIAAASSLLLTFPPQEISVTTEAELAMAMANARPGQVISLAVHPYKFKRDFKTEHGGTAERPITLRATGDEGYAVLEVGGTVGFRIQHEHWVFEGIHFKGDPNQTQATVFLDGTANCSDIVIRDCKISGSASYGLKSSRSREQAADRVSIEHSELFDCGKTGFDGVGGDDWILRRNYVHDYGTSGGISYGIFLKGGGKNGLIEGNLVDAGSRKGTVGISFGGGKTGEQWMPQAKGLSIPEHFNGVCRNNIVMRTGDVAYHSNNADSCTFIANLAYACSGFQRQGSRGEDPVLINNLVGKLRGAATTSHHNLGAGEAEWFVDASAMDFRLSKKGLKALRGKAKFTDANALDLFGTKRSRERTIPGPIAKGSQSSRRKAESVWVDRR